MSNIYDYHIKDAKRIEEVIKRPIVDVVITSPPYWNLKNYGVDDQVGFGQKYEDYLNDITIIFEKCKNVLKDNGSIWIVVDSFKKGGDIRLLPFELAQRLKEKGLFLQDIIIWQKDKTLPWSSKGKLRNIFEYILFFTKHKKEFKYNVDRLRELELKKWWVKYPERYNPKGKVPSRVWEIPIPIQGWGKAWVRHFCPFPPRLVERILLLTTDEGDVVLDPFAGSGSVLAQAKVMKRKSIGFDVNPEYKEMYKEKVLPFFKELWKKREKELAEEEKKRKYLEETIISLRKIKYPIQLIKCLMQWSPELVKEINFVIAYDSSEIKYYFVLNRECKKIRESIIKVRNHKLMKKFSMTPVINVILLNEISGIDFKTKMYLYENGINNVYKTEINLKEWIYQRKNAYVKEKIPPIVSNIRIYKKDFLI